MTEPIETETLNSKRNKIEDKILQLNKLAMENVSSNEAKIQLDKAKSLIESNESFFDSIKFETLLSVTLNNQACHYKRLELK